MGRGRHCSMVVEIRMVVRVVNFQISVDTNIESV